MFWICFKAQGPGDIWRHALRMRALRFLLVHLLDFLQWPAMIVTVLSAWFVGSQKKHRRKWGFWLFLTSNVLWIIWGWHDHAYALIVLQIGLAFINIRGAAKNEPSG